MGPALTKALQILNDIWEFLGKSARWQRSCKSETTLGSPWSATFFWGGQQTEPNGHGANPNTKELNFGLWWIRWIEKIFGIWHLSGSAFGKRLTHPRKTLWITMFLGIFNASWPALNTHSEKVLGHFGVAKFQCVMISLLIRVQNVLDNFKIKLNQILRKRAKLDFRVFIMDWWPRTLAQNIARTSTTASMTVGNGDPALIKVL